ncbi:MAG TPA: OFA family MFS transporter [Actinomycetales bacterium]|nr:OFA family MFS transporter [Actinomycetales bacterium]
MKFLSVLSKERSVASASYNRWLVPPAALAIHLSIGQAYAFSVFKLPLVEHFGSSDTAIAVIFSIAIVMLGLSAAFGGTWVERNGPRKAMVLSTVCWTSGFAIAALGVQLGHLWIVYLGYGFIGGIGLGIGYISPVSTLMKWFPDRPGLATGLAIMGFGGGALIASPLSNTLLAHFGSPIAAGIVPTFFTLAVVYLILMSFGAALIRLPAPNWKPAGYVPTNKPQKLTTTAQVSAAGAIKTPQFYLLWTLLFCNITAGIGILEQASPMIQAYFSNITAASAAGFVGVLSIANMAGRFIWSSSSDRIGRKPIYMLYLGLGAILFVILAQFGHSAVALFVTVAVIAISFYGGGFATIPAYLRDLFGTFEVGAIHGRVLTAWSAAGVAGPLIVNLITDSQHQAGISGAGAYTPSLMVMAGLLTVGFLANLAIRPVASKHHLPAAPIEVSVAKIPEAVGR